MVIGPRVWKTGLAVTITLWIAELFSLEYPYLAVIATIISLQPTITDSLKKGWERIQATAIGVIIALAIMFVLESTPIFVGIAVILTILICLRYGWTESITLASVTVVIIMAGSRDDTFGYALQRSTVLPFVGIIIAVAINLLFSPPQYLEMVKKSLRDLNEGIELLMMRVINSFLTCENYSPEHIQQLVDKIYVLYEDAKEKFNMYQNERGYKKYFNGKKAAELSNLERVLEIMWLIAQRVIDIQNVTDERCGRISKIENPSTQYNDLLNSVQEFLFQTTALEKNLIENYLEPNENRKDIIERQIEEITTLRESLRERINDWQESHLGPTHIRSLIEIATLVYDLDQICNLLFKLKELQDK
ncbi:FUSC family protein [Natranaerobius trueperi]|uniref:FUSC family protein n=1 Tax=Natranaerobius trueperi TaxID=759412 RepID=UPI001303958B|nr:aromatic acid exporter family protein [Natranaerobius trueperi]